MNLRNKTHVLLIAVMMLMPAMAQAQTPAPAKIQAALFMKLLAFYTNLGSDPFSIHVIDEPEVAKELQSLVGRTAGKATLNAVTQSTGAPTEKAQVVYVGGNIQEAIAYSRANKVLSVTGNPDFVTEGVTLGVGIENRKPKILLNLSSSKSEEINWNPAILKVAATIK